MGHGIIESFVGCKDAIDHLFKVVRHGLDERSPVPPPPKPGAMFPRIHPGGISTPGSRNGQNSFCKKNSTR
ncbi:hypothetical protein SAICODRAFT_32207 [Saitoella complicata NRRL Y-17804]|uniref:uncharacterized protein n=1 Tax=Saitoella complicata (strain BCRC 22490 / CBS 7301 / JCM 7358 / NBRC 10748 / NRRL Y-17804) TaxID=698492 RepID=UPI0008680804|nr:uncharacterized protein SAICODRAFT_32207 [Saitoella complicata NRRL Y-17804]ODQ49872.1 hypothetical protein SAICODRAFT_32207 [Saitoella complicata NRRL Y-17804]